MPVALKDKFSDLNLSRQRRYQLRQKAAGRCRWCGTPSKTSRCDSCKEKRRQAQKAKLKTTQKNGG